MAFSEHENAEKKSKRFMAEIASFRAEYKGIKIEFKMMERKYKRELRLRQHAEERAAKAEEELKLLKAGVTHPSALTVFDNLPKKVQQYSVNFVWKSFEEFKQNIAREVNMTIPQILVCIDGGCPIVRLLFISPSIPHSFSSFIHLFYFVFFNNYRKIRFTNSGF